MVGLMKPATIPIMARAPTLYPMKNSGTRASPPPSTRGATGSSTWASLLSRALLPSQTASTCFSTVRIATTTRARRAILGASCCTSSSMGASMDAWYQLTCPSSKVSQAGCQTVSPMMGSPLE